MSEIWSSHPRLKVDVSDKGRVRDRETGSVLPQSNYRIYLDGMYTKVESLVMECFMEKPLNERRSCVFLDGDAGNCAVSNIVMLPAFFPSKRYIRVVDGRAYHVCRCGDLFPIRPDRTWQHGRYYYCDPCLERERARTPRHRPRIEVRGDRVYRQCKNCREMRTLDLFYSEDRGCNVQFCRHCREATGPFQAGRPARMAKVKPLRKLRVFEYGTRNTIVNKISDMETELIRKLDEDHFPYTTPGKLEVLQEIGMIVRAFFKQPVRFLLMPNLGKEIAVYLKMGGIVKLRRSIMVERDELIFDELKWICRRFCQNVQAVRSDVNDYIMNTSSFDFKVAHLDYFSVFTERAREAVDRLLAHGKLVFITVQDPRRWAGKDGSGVELRFRHGRVFWGRPYAGNRGTRMITYAIVPNGGVGMTPKELRAAGNGEELEVTSDVRNAVQHLYKFVEMRIERAVRLRALAAGVATRHAAAQLTPEQRRLMLSRSRETRRAAFEARWWETARQYRQFLQCHGADQMTLSERFGTSEDEFMKLYNWQMATRIAVKKERTLSDAQKAFLAEINFERDPTLYHWNPVIAEIREYLAPMKNLVFVPTHTVPPGGASSIFRNFCKRFADGEYVHPQVEEDLRSIGFTRESVSLRALVRQYKQDVLRQLVAGTLSLTDLRATGEESWAHWRTFFQTAKLSVRRIENDASRAAGGSPEVAHRARRQPSLGEVALP